MGQRIAYCSFLITAIAVFFAAAFASADAYDPPANYYDFATATNSTLKGQLKKIIDTINDPEITIETLHTPTSYDNARIYLQVTDADTSQSNHVIMVYDRTSLDVSGLTGPPAGWDSGSTWNREHVWPRSRGVGSSGPDDSDLFNLRPALTENNGDRGNINFGGAYGAQSWGVVSDGGTMWYPGDADAGMIARQAFYMAVRYDDSDASTNDLEIGVGNPADVTGTTDDPPPQLGNLTRLLEWHFAAPPDDFERRRNDVIFDSYQHNRDPFIDRPEFVWPVFVDSANDSRISIAGTTIGGDGGSTRNVDLGRVFVGGAVPAAQMFTLNKDGSDGTYFEVTTGGAATSSIGGRYNAFRTNQTDSKSITVGLSTNTAASGLKSGNVTINNLDITTGGGAGHGANDANDTFNVSLSVLDHALPSFAGGAEVTSLMYDFGTLGLNDPAPTFGFDVFNFDVSTMDSFNPADLDFDSVMSTGDTGAMSVDFEGAPSVLTLGPGGNEDFTAMLDTSTIGDFSATYTLNFSDENLVGALNKSITLTLLGAVEQSLLFGDYNRDNIVDAADYTVWRNTFGEGVAEDYDSADGDGDSMIGEGDYVVWMQHYGEFIVGPGGGGLASPTVPEPAGWLLAIFAVAAIGRMRRR